MIYFCWNSSKQQQKDPTRTKIISAIKLSFWYRNTWISDFLTETVLPLREKGGSFYKFQTEVSEMENQVLNTKLGVVNKDEWQSEWWGVCVCD
jgi:hypothetical protein